VAFSSRNISFSRAHLHIKNGSTSAFKTSKHCIMRLDRPVKTIAIIGGGPSGAIALNTLLEEGEFEEIVLFERRDQLGGIWNLNDSKSDSALNLTAEGVKDYSPNIPVFESNELIREGHDSPHQKFYGTAGYPGMRTNVTEDLMTFSDDTKWPRLIPPEEAGFTNAEAVHAYLLKYFEKVKSKANYKIELQTSVEEVTKAGDKFQLVLKKDLSDGKERWYKQQFDAVIIAPGNFNVPFIPTKYPGILDVNKDVLFHSRFYKNNKQFTNKTVLVVGSRVSGVDMVKLISPVAKELYISHRSTPSTIKSQNLSNVWKKPDISKVEQRDDGKVSVQFKDDTEVVFDYIVFATGYQLSFPFLKKFDPDFTTGNRINNLYLHTFYTPDPLLISIGLYVSSLSYRAFEYQAITAARFLSGKGELPSKEEQQKWYNDRVDQYGDSKDFYFLNFDENLDIFDELINVGGGIEGKRRYFVLTEDQHRSREAARRRLEGLADTI